MTIRAEADPSGPLYMPGSRQTAMTAARVVILMSPFRSRLSEPRHLSSTRCLGRTTMDLRCGWRIFHPRAPLRGFSPSLASHYLVLDGGLAYEGHVHPAISDFFIDDLGPGDATAGATGLIALVLQFPVPGDRDRSLTGDT